MLYCLYSGIALRIKILIGGDVMILFNFKNVLSTLYDINTVNDILDKIEKIKKQSKNLENNDYFIYEVKKDDFIYLRYMTDYIALELLNENLYYENSLNSNIVIIPLSLKNNPKFNISIFMNEYMNNIKNAIHDKTENKKYEYIDKINSNIESFIPIELLQEYKNQDITYNVIDNNIALDFTLDIIPVIDDKVKIDITNIILDDILLYRFFKKYINLDIHKKNDKYYIYNKITLYIHIER